MKQTLVTLILNLCAITAMAGVVNGGGGRGVFCKQADGTLTGKTLDLYEGEAIWRYRMNAPVGDFKKEIEVISEKLGNFMMPHEYVDSNRYEYGYRGLMDLYSRLQDIPSGSHLRDTADSYEPVIPNDCEIKQVINYYGDEVILVDRELFNTLTPQSQAAMVAHEWVYYTLRQLYDVNGSKSARRTVAKLFSGEKLPPAGYSFDRSQPYLRCHGNEINAVVFYVYSPVNDPNASGIIFDFASYKHRYGSATVSSLLHSTLFSADDYGFDLSLNCLMSSYSDEYACSTMGMRIDIKNEDMDSSMFASIIENGSNRFVFRDGLTSEDLGITCEAHNFTPPSAAKAMAR